MGVQLLDFGDCVSICPPDLGDPLVIDNFAGGASTGIENAMGRSVDIAINHDAEAIAMHIANHAGTRHCCQSINAIDPLEETQGRPVALAWYSPDCKDHSKAKGGVPREKHIRDLAWIVPHHIERLKKGTPDGEGAPRVILLENVEEFRDWGPLDAEGYRIKARKGEEFKRWVGRIRRLGYRVQWRELRACDYGAPTSRKRFYLCARRDGRPIVWPKPTHGKPGTPAVLSGKRQPWRTAAECIDWSIPAPSIFDRKRDLKEATMRRIAHGVMRYVVNAAQPYVIDGTAFHITKFYTGSIGSDAANPMPTVTANGKSKRPAGATPLGVVDAAIVPITHSGDDMRVHSTKEPTRTITTANGGEFALATATVALLDKFNQNSRGRPANAPLDTAMAGATRHAAVTAFLSQFYSSNKRGSGGDLREPGKTSTAEGQHQAIVCAHMEQANTGMVGHPMPKPVSTIVGKGCTQRLVETTLIEEGALPPEMMQRAVRVAAFLIKYYGAAAHGQAADRPLDAVTSKARFAVVTVTIDAVTYVIVDIGMRMLTPRELARAQGFPDSYILEAIGPNGRPLSKAAQIRMIGNSVCPDVAEALVRANLPEMCVANDNDDQLGEIAA